jgi:pyruvate kinase
MVIIKTKIICTIGPATGSFSAIKELYDAGMNVARINCSHGDHLQYRDFIKNIRSVSKDIAIMFDTQGPEIRTGMVRPGTVLKAGTTFKLTRNRIIGDETEVHVTYTGLVDDVKKGDAILIDSGFLELKVISKSGNDILTKVIVGGPLGNQKGVNHPACVAKISSFTKKDKEDISFGLAHGIDFVAASFVKNAGDVLKIKSFLRTHPHVKVLAKIENAAAVTNVSEIIKAADGVMVARGDLGVEVPEEKLPIIQKEIIKKCNIAGKPVVTATQMLESMVNNPRPTRAETTDVANAILDGTDAIMLSEETAIGNFPSKAVSMMVSIARNTEPVLEMHRKFSSRSTDDAVANAVSSILQETGISKVIVCTCSGHSARLISKYRPHADIIAVTPYEQVVRMMGLFWGVDPIIVDDHVSSTRDLIFHSIKSAYDKGMITRKEHVVVTAGSPFNIRGRTNLIEIHHVGEILDRGPSAYKK